MKYTIVLMYPDYIAENYGEETYTAYVDADTLRAAIDSATEEALKANKITKKSGLRRPEDWAVVFACQGHVENEYAGF